MQENKFDRQVKELMDELKLDPSTEVWQKVEERIRPGRRRRILLVIPFLLGFALIGYTIYQNGERSQPEENNTGAMTTKPGAQTNMVLQQATGAEKVELRRDRQSLTEDISSSTTVNYTNTTNNIFPTPVGTGTAQPASLFTPGVERQRAVETPEEITLQPQNLSTVARPGSQQDESGTTIAETDSTDPTTINNTDSTTINDKLKDQKAEAEHKEAAIRQSRGLQWSFRVTTGVSKLSGEPVPFSDKSLEDLAASPNTGSGGMPVARPAEHMAGPAFKAGIFIQKYLGNRSSIQAGLQYAYYSDHLFIGEKRDSAVRSNGNFSQNFITSYYEAEGSSRYTNRFHMLELPLSFNLKLNKSRKTPISWNAGIGAAYLLNTNAIVFDTTAGGIYFTDLDLFRRWHLNLSSGFSLTLPVSGGFTLSGGLILQVPLTGIHKPGINRRGFLSYAGLQFSMQIPKK